MAGRRLFVLVLLSIGSLGATAAWLLSDEAERGSSPVAYAESDTGQRVEIYIGDRSTVLLRLILGAGFETFAESSCPTFQIDRREPMHHFEVGYYCAVVAKRATFLLGQINDSAIT